MPRNRVGGASFVMLNQRRRTVSGTFKRGDDAGDHTPASNEPAKSTNPDGKQDAANYETRTDDAGAIEVENLSSENDEGAP